MTLGRPGDCLDLATITDTQLLEEPRAVEAVYGLTNKAIFQMPVFQDNGVLIWSQILYGPWLL